MNIQLGGQRPANWPSCLPIRPLSGHLPASCGLPSRGRTRGLLHRGTWRLPCLVGLFIPPGASKAPPTAGGATPTGFSKTLLLSCSGRRKPGRIAPLLSILCCFLFSREKPQSTQQSQGHIPSGPSPGSLWSLLFLKYTKHASAPGPLHLLFWTQYLHDLSPCFFQVFAEMSLCLILLFKIITSVFSLSLAFPVSFSFPP